MQRAAGASGRAAGAASLTGTSLADVGAGAGGGPSSAADLALVHNLAQFCHCLAQGKVGSGFDVSAAVYGSHRYRRFSADVLSALLAEVGPLMTVPRVAARLLLS